MARERPHGVASIAALRAAASITMTSYAMTRYAIYFAPAPESVWWRRGCEWLGRDAETGVCSDLPPIAGVPIALQRQLTHNARRYGFHATLKAPFYLAPGFNEGHLLSMAQTFARCQSRLSLPPLEVSLMGAFLALQPVASDLTSATSVTAINAFAMRCVSYFDILRAPPSAAELVRRRQSGLTPRQDALLTRWGYPYTEEAYRFHMTLTDALTGVEPNAAAALHAAAESCFVAARSVPLQIDNLAVYREASAGAAFELVARFAFASTTAR